MVEGVSIASPIRNGRSNPCTEMSRGALTNKKLLGYIVSEHHDAIYLEQVLRGYGSNVSPKKHLNECAHGESVAWRWSIMALPKLNPPVCQETVHLCARVVLPKPGVMDNPTQPCEFTL